MGENAIKLSAGLNIQHFFMSHHRHKLLMWGLCWGRILMLPNEPSLSTPLSS